eukprot:m.60635 g.60635  ORF g.60635 m.60635 type:complete len:651 (+) comp13297_c0_seq4:1084-3036(+)
MAGMTSHTSTLFEVGTFCVYDHLIGTGASRQATTIHAAKETMTEHSVIAKVVNKAALTQQFRQRLMRSVNSLLTLTHPNIVEYFWLHETDDHVFFFLEEGQGSLLNVIQRHGRIQPSLARNYFAQLLSAVDYLHQSDIAHRNIKLEHLLVFPNQTIKLIGFGFSAQVQEASLQDADSIVVDSPHYSPPEYFLHVYADYDPRSADIWAMGVVLFAMLRATMPFRGNTIMELSRNVVIRRPARLFTCPHLVSLLSIMLSRCWRSRATVADLQQSAYLASCPTSRSSNARPDAAWLEAAVYDRLLKLGFTDDDLALHLKLNFSQPSAIANVLRHRLRSSLEHWQTHDHPFHTFSEPDSSAPLHPEARRNVTSAEASTCYLGEAHPRFAKVQHTCECGQGFDTHSALDAISPDRQMSSNLAAYSADTTIRCSFTAQQNTLEQRGRSPSRQPVCRPAQLLAPEEDVITTKSPITIATRTAAATASCMLRPSPTASISEVNALVDQVLVEEMAQNKGEDVVTPCEKDSLAVQRQHHAHHRLNHDEVSSQDHTSDKMNTSTTFKPTAKQKVPLAKTSPLRRRPSCSSGSRQPSPAVQTKKLKLAISRCLKEILGSPFVMPPLFHPVFVIQPHAITKQKDGANPNPYKRSKPTFPSGF